MGSTNQREGRRTVLRSPEPGTYQIAIRGNEDSRAGLVILDIGMGRTPDSTKEGLWSGIDSTFKGIITPGGRQEYDLNFHRDTSKALSARKVVTPSSMQQELEGMEEMGWIGGALLEDISARTRQVGGYLSKQDSTLARTRLRVVRDRLDAAEDDLGGNDRGSAYQILKSNVAAMRSQWSAPLALAPLPGALVVAARSVDAKFSGNRLTITGTDHALDGAPSNTGNDAHAVWATTTATQQSILDALKRNTQGNLTGTGADAPDVRRGALGFDLAALAEAAAGEAERRLPEKLSGKEQVGTLQQPVVAYAPEGLKMSGQVEGAGILVVGGALEMKGRSRWRGLVIVRSPQVPEADLGGNAQVIGGMAMLNPSGTVTLNLIGNAAVRLSRRALRLAGERLR